MFKFENNLPEYWLNESRDFQLLTRLDDILFMGQRADIATISNLNDSKKCKNSTLNLLAKKVGFFTNKYIDDNVLRNIISAFKIAVKYKGTEQGILYAVTAILKSENSTEAPLIDISMEDHTINIYTPVKIINIVALKEFLKYIIPTGFIYNIYAYSGVSKQKDIISPSDKINFLKYSDYSILGRVMTGEIDENSIEKDENYMKNFYRSSMYSGTVVGEIKNQEDIKT